MRLSTTYHLPHTKYHIPSTKYHLPSTNYHIPSPKPAFTIVELLIVIIVIAILATLTIISYSGISNKAVTASIQADLSSNSKLLKLYNTQYGSYPASLDGNNCPVASGSLPADNNYCLKVSGSNNISNYTGTTSSFVLKITNTNATYAVTESISPTISTTDGITIQTITSSNCPTVRTRAVDARDNHTYWVQKLADGKCWMLTNLAYAGGGTNTYSDTRTLTNGTGGSGSYTAAQYYVVPSTTNFTTEPTNPSTSTDGTGQYGYLYNWCGAMGAQATAACNIATTPIPNANITICPSGWRLPVGNGNEFTTLNNAVNAGLTNTDLGLRINLLIQRSGWWGNNEFGARGYEGHYWSSVQYSDAKAYEWIVGSSYVIVSYENWKGMGFAVRCLAV